VKKILIYLLCVAFSLMLLVSGLVAGIIYWAYTGPRDLSAYTKDIEASINEVLKGNLVKIGTAKLAFGGLEQPIYIDATNVVIMGQNGSTVANLREMQLTYGIMKLVTGNFVPSELRLVGFDVDTTDFFESKQESSLDLKDFDLSELRLIELKQGKLKIAKIAEEWAIESLKLQFKGNDITIAGTVYPSLGEKITVAGKGVYNRGNYEVVSKVENLATQRFIAFAPELEGTSFVIDGSIATRLKNKELESIAADITSIKGEAVNPNLRDKLTINTGAVNASYVFKSKDITIKSMDLLFGDEVKLAGSGSMTGQGDIQVDAVVESMPIGKLNSYWPVDVGDNAIAWINEHLRKGVIPKGVAKINIKGTDVKAGTIPADAVDFNFNISNMDINYVPELLPVKKATGTAHMNTNSLRIKVENGSLGTSTISNTKVDITEIGGVQELLRVEGDINGSVRDIADFYIKVNKRRGKELLFKSTQDLSGSAKTKLIVSLPLKADLLFEQVGIDLDSNITNGTAKTEKFTAKDVNINLKVNDKGYAVKGTMLATIGGPDKDYNFSDVPLKVDFSKYGAPKIALDADITNSEIAIKQLGAAKPKGEKGRTELMVSGSAINKFVLDSSSIKAIGTGTLNAAMDDIKTLKLTSFEAGGSKLTADIEKNGGYKVSFLADVLNAVPIIDSLDTSEPSKDPTKIALSGKVAKMLFHQNQALENVTLKITCTAECNYVDIDSKDLKIEQTPAKLLITSDNAGKILKMLDAYENMEGGKLTIDGKGIGRNGYQGIAKIEDFSIQRAKVLAKILTLGSLTGIADVLQGKGISFKRLRTKFTRTDEMVKIDDFRMFGASIGVTTDGVYNRKTEEIEFQGKIIPAYTANTLLGKIPILGDIIIGDEGVFAFAYDVKGKMDDPQVFVNPLSVLAPGFLQEIFQQ
jgi:hypothetical protein